MKNLMTKQNLMILGVALATAFVVYKVISNREKAPANTPVNKSADETSDFCGCGA